MRAVATALVLIAGAAVILWYGSTLNNSWVLGGLIGGLAALLLSIPISLTLFTHFSRRHDERLHAEEEEEYERVREYDNYDDYDYPVIPARRPQEVEGTVIYEEDEDAYDEDDETYEEYWREEEVRRREPRRPSAPGVAGSRIKQRQTTTRQATNNVDNRLPSPAPQAYLPPPRQQPQQPAQSLKTPRRDTKSLRSGPLHTMSQHRMEALRTARREAARESEDALDDIEVSPTQYPRQERSVRSEQQARSRFEQEAPYTTHRRAERPSQPSRKSGGPSSLAGREDRNYPQTDYINKSMPQTEPVRRPRTKDLQGTPQAPMRGADTTDIIHLNKPLVRRAPYLYEDDDLRERFAQQIEQMDPPRVRRSSRQEALQEDEDY